MTISGKTILVTGGAGAIGGALCRALLEKGCRRLIVMDDLSSGFRDHVPDGAVFLYGSITDDALLEKAFAEKPEIIFHLAAHFANQNSVEHPREDHETNIIGTLKLLERSRFGRVERFVYASSSCVYGAQAGPLREDQAPGHLETPYAVSKYAGEGYARLYHKLYNLPTVIVRYFNSFGPGEKAGKYRNVIPNFIAQALAGEPLPITGTGEETRDFCFIENIVAGTIVAAENDAAEGQAYNLGSGQETTIRTLAETINRLTGNAAGIAYAPRRAWDHITRRCADIRAARNDLGYAPMVDMEKQLQTTIEWFRNTEKKKTVGIVIDWYLPRIGGGELYAYNLATYLQKNGYEVAVFSLDEGNTAGWADEFPTTRVRWEKGIRGKIQFYRALKKFLDGADIIHAIYCHKFAAYVALYNFFRRKPFFISLQGRGILDLPGNNRFYANVHTFYRAFSLKSCTAAIAACHEFVTRARRYIPPERIAYIPNGVDLSVFDSAPDDAVLRQKYASLKVILTVRRLVPKNGIQFLVEALPQIVQRHPDALAVFVGPGPLEEYLKKRVAALGMERHVEFAGRVENTNVPKYLAVAQVVVFPSTAEATSLACLEAMAMKKAIVASKVGGYPEMIDDGVNGYVVQLTDGENSDYDAPMTISEERKQALAARISELLDNTELRRQFGDRAHTKALSSFSWDVLIRQILALYKKSNKETYTTFSDKILDKRYNSPNSLRRYAHRAQYQSVVDQVPSGSRVLDAGCGEGALSCLLAAKGCTVTGVDISAPNIERAKALAREMGVEDSVSFLQGDAEHLPVPDASFDAVVSSHVLEHLPDFDQGLRELHRVSRDKVVVALPTILNLCSIVQAGHGSFWELSKRSLLAFPLGLFKTLVHLFGEGVDEGYSGNKKLTHIFRWPWVMRRRLRRGGFAILYFEASTLCLPYFSWLLPFIRALDRLKDKPFFRNFGYGSTAVLKKL